jgi:AGZA family xanthine/uracil permease-like MFS transporter
VATRRCSILVISASQPSYFRLVPGDVNGFLGLVVDNLSVLGLLAAVLIGGYGVPADIVFGKMFPGTALGVLLGDLAYTWLAMRLARRTGRRDVTAMPFGLDTPSTIGMALLVLGPAYAKFRAAGLDPTSAGLETWYLGMAATAAMGILKLLLSFAGRTVRRVIPMAGLLGSLAGIALTLIGFFPMIDLLQFPMVGLLTLGLILYALVAKGSAPFGMPGVLFAVIVGTLFYYGAGHFGFLGMQIPAPAMPTLRLAFPHPDPGIFHGFAGLGDYLALIIPFALLTIVGGVNNTESARVAGDDYDVRSILLAEAAATLLAGLAGGVAQTTPYIGHPAFKEMGARSGYTLLTGVFVGVGGMLGFLANLIEMVPLAVLAPVLVFLALNITAQAFSAVPARHAIAVAISFFPSIARLLTIELSDPKYISPQKFAALMTAPEHGLPALSVIVALGNGFIITATIWAAFVVEMIERRLRAAAIYLAAAGILCFFGIVHSVRLDGSAYVLAQLDGNARNAAIQFCAAYFVLAGVLMLLSLQRHRATPNNKI